MGFVSFWSNITGPKVKEITPLRETPWLDRGRPSTSSGTRFGKQRPGSTGDEMDKRPTTANGEKKTKRFRSLSRPRTSHIVDSEFQRKGSIVEGDPGKDVPDIPALPAGFSQEDTRQQDIPTPEDSSPRPGTGLTTESLQELQIFELPAESISADVTICTEKRLSRKRSRSPVRASMSPKSSQYLETGLGKNKALPPPPPPTGPLPPLPDTALASTHQRPVLVKFATLHDDQSLRRSHSSTFRSETKPRLTRSSSENDSILRAFPAVPPLVHDDEQTPDSSVTNSEDSSVSSPTREKHMFSCRKRTIPCSIKVDTAPCHMHKDSAIGTPSPYTPSGVQRWTRQVQDAEQEGDATGWTEAELREWDEVSQFMECAHGREMNSSVHLMKGFEMDVARMRAVKHNEQALAELQFGVLK